MDGVEGDSLEVLYVGSQAKDKGSPQLGKTWPSGPQPLGTEEEAHALPSLLEGLLGCVFLHPVARFPRLLSQHCAKQGEEPGSETG